MTITPNLFLNSRSDMIAAIRVMQIDQGLPVCSAIVDQDIGRQVVLLQKYFSTVPYAGYPSGFIFDPAKVKSNIADHSLPGQIVELQVLLGGASGSGVLPLITATDTAFLTATGCTAPNYGFATSPSSFYVSSTNTIWYFWEGWNGSVRWVLCKTRNLTTGVWSPVYLVTDANTLTDDDHGVPSGVEDADGYEHAFWGSHGGNFCHTTHTTNPNDPSSWTVDADVPVNATYPKPSLVGSDIWLFIRETVTAGTAGNNPLVYFKATPSSGAIASWGTKTTAITFDTGDPDGSRVYAGEFVKVGTELHFCVTFANGNDTYRQNVYYYIFDTVAETLTNFARTITIAKASFPVTLAQSNSSFLLRNQTATGHITNIPALGFDSNGKAHIAYMDGPVGGPFNLYHAFGTLGSAFPSSASDDLVGAFPTNDPLHRFDEFDIIPLQGGAVDVAWVTDSGLGFARGGNISKRTWSGSAFGTQTLVQQARAAYALDRIETTRYAPTNVSFPGRWTFSETTQDAITESGVLRKFAYGDSGYLRRPFQAQTLTRAAAIAALGTTVTDQHKESIDELYQAIAAYAPSKLDSLFNAWAPSKVASYVDWMNPVRIAQDVGGGPAWISGSWTGNGTSTKINTTFVPSLHAVNGSLNDNGFMWRVNATTTGDANFDCGAIDGISNDVGNSFHSTQNAVQFQIDEITSLFGTAAAGGQAWWGIDRTSSTAIAATKNGVLQVTKSQASISLPATAEHICGTSLGTQWGSRPLQSWSWGKSMTAAQRLNMIKWLGRYSFSQGL